MEKDSSHRKGFDIVTFDFSAENGAVLERIASRVLRNLPLWAQIYVELRRQWALKRTGQIIEKRGRPSGVRAQRLMPPEVHQKLFKKAISLAEEGKGQAFILLQRLRGEYPGLSSSGISRGPADVKSRGGHVALPEGGLVRPQKRSRRGFF